jgi:CBS domain-containing protein
LSTHSRANLEEPQHHLNKMVREIMTPGVVAIVEDASLRQTYRCMVCHGVHAVLTVGAANRRPLGWITARGLLSWMSTEHELICARDAVTERPRAIEPSATVSEAIVALSRPDTTRLLVAVSADSFPEGVVSELDIIALVD